MTVSRRSTHRVVTPIQQEQDPPIHPAFASRVPAISSTLNNSTSGIMICDKTLRCIAANLVFASMHGAPAGKQVGKTIAQFFGSDAAQIESPLHRVWETGKPASDLEFHASSPEKNAIQCLAVNLRPIKDASGQMRFIAAIFSDATTKARLQRRLDELLARPEAPSTSGSQPSGEDLSEVQAGSANVLRRGIDTVICSTVVRCHLSEVRIASALLPAGLFVILEEDSEKNYKSALLRMVSMHEPPAEMEISDEISAGAKQPSPRERQIVQLLAEGKANKEIAAILALSTRTVEIYRARLMEKLDLHSVGELVRYAFRHHIVEV